MGAGMSDNVITELIDRLARIETKIDDYNNLRDKLDKAYGITKGNEKDIIEIKDNQKWLWRAFVGGLIGLIMSFISSMIIWRG